MMEIVYGENSMLLKLLYLFNSYFFTIVIIWAVIYFLFAYLVNTLVKNYSKNKEDILEKLSRCVVENRQVECVRILEEYPECINKYTKSGYTPFLMACATGNIQILKLMLKKGEFMFITFLYRFK